MACVRGDSDDVAGSFLLCNFREKLGMYSARGGTVSFVLSGYKMEQMQGHPCLVVSRKQRNNKKKKKGNGSHSRLGKGERESSVWIRNAERRDKAREKERRGREREEGEAARFGREPSQSGKQNHGKLFRFLLCSGWFPLGRVGQLGWRLVFFSLTRVSGPRKAWRAFNGIFQHRLPRG